MHDLTAQACLAPFAGASGCLVAVSGGPDSMALLHLAAAWSRQPGAPPVAAATVDHGLRAESVAEVDLVAEAAARLGLPHHRLVWDGAKPATRLQERARAARYRLLAACARHIGADTILTAHHADDQAETVLFRLLRGSGPAGLAGMAVLSRREGLVIGRPLLAWRKSECVALCQSLAQAFVTDPSNTDPRFARARLRQLAPVLAPEGLDTPALIRLARRAGRASAAIDQTVAALRKRAELSTPDGSIAFTAAALAAEPEEIVLRLLDRAIADLAGTRPRLDRLEAVMDRLGSALSVDAPWTATLGGVVLRLTRGTLRLDRERPRRSGAKALETAASQPEG